MSDAPLSTMTLRSTVVSVNLVNPLNDGPFNLIDTQGHAQHVSIMWPVNGTEGRKTYQVQHFEHPTSVIRRF